MKQIKKYIKEIFKVLKKREMRVLPGNIAFFFMLALVPILTIIAYLASYFSISIEALAELITKVFPSGASTTIIDIISGKGFDSHLGFINLAAVVVATNGTYSIVSASNTLYKIKKTDPIKDRVKSIWLFMIILVLILFILIVPMFGDKILTLFTKIEILNNISDELILFFNILKWPLTMFIIYFNVKLVYTISPNIEVKSKDTTKGAIFTTSGWTIATIIFSFYLKYFGRYDIIYGNLSSIIILMMWLYILAYIFVLGLAINTRNIND